MMTMTTTEVIVPEKKRRTHARLNAVVGQPLPLVLTLRDLADIFRMDFSNAFRCEQRGEFRAFEMSVLVGKRRRYSGRKVQAALDADGGPISRHFTSGLRKRGGV
jgi:hypothetical protein